MIPSPNPILTEPRFFQRHGFQLAIGGFILVCSFLYGISAGLGKATSTAHAKFVPFTEDGGVPALSRLTLPAGVVASPLGRDVTINDHPAELVSFVSGRAA